MAYGLGLHCFTQSGPCHFYSCETRRGWEGLLSKRHIPWTLVKGGVVAWMAGASGLGLPPAPATGRFKLPLHHCWSQVGGEAESLVSVWLPHVCCLGGIVGPLRGLPPWHMYGDDVAGVQSQNALLVWCHLATPHPPKKSFIHSLAHLNPNYQELIKIVLL